MSCMDLTSNTPSSIRCDFNCMRLYFPFFLNNFFRSRVPAAFFLLLRILVNYKYHKTLNINPIHQSFLHNYLLLHYMRSKSYFSFQIDPKMLHFLTQFEDRLIEFKSRLYCFRHNSWCSCSQLFKYPSQNKNIIFIPFCSRRKGRLSKLCEFKQLKMEKSTLFIKNKILHTPSKWNNLAKE